jgi:hypothetical protein
MEHHVHNPANVDRTATNQRRPIVDLSRQHDDDEHDPDRPDNDDRGPVHDDLPAGPEQ